MDERTEPRGFAYYRTSSALPFPQSIATALRAFKNEQIPVEPVLFRAGSADTMFQQPLNIPLLKEVFSASRLHTETNRKIARILFSYVGDTDQEVSDFAAQYLSKLEERYLKTIREMERIEERTPTESIELAQLYFDFSTIEEFNPTLQQFYLNKSRTTIEEISDELPTVHFLRARIALFLGAADEAIRIMESSPFRRSVEGLLILAEAAFHNRDISGVYRLIEEIAALAGEERSSELQAVIDHWRRYE